MVVCTFFQQGRCKYGSRCRYEHPGQQTSSGGGNRFGALSGGGGFGSRASSGQSQQSQQSAQSQQNNTSSNYGITTSDIQTDLTAGKGRPEWIFSCYGPGRNAPRQLFGGPQRELSFEELRLRHYEAAATGNANPAIEEAQNLYNEAVKQMEVILRDLNGAVKYINDGAHEHPNRIDIAQGRAGPSTSQGSSGLSQTPAFGPPGFAQQSQQSQPAFGQPSFGQPSFGQPSLGQASSFGQPSSLGQKSTFGTSSGLGAQSTFGKPTIGGFSNPPPIPPPHLVQKAAETYPSVFGSGSPFSQISNLSHGPPTGFGQSSGPPSISPFAQLGSGQSSSFGQPTTTPATSGFSTPAQRPNPFSQPQEVSNPFGGTIQVPTPTVTGIRPVLPPEGATYFPPPPDGSIAATGGTGSILRVDNPDELNPIPPLNGETRRDPLSKKLLAWKGQPVRYIDNVPCYLHPQDRKTAVRIFFPDGPPDKANLRDAYAEPEKYTPEVVEQYEFFVKNGHFKDGIIPSVPPKPEWVSFDF